MSNESAILQDSFGWDVVNWSRGPQLWSQALPADSAGIEALEVGCGPLNGGLSLWLASKGAKVIASSERDFSNEMGVFHDRHELLGSIDFEVIDIREIPYPDRFDVVCLKSMLGGIGREGHLEVQKAALDVVAAALKPGGVLLFIENLVSTSAHMALRRRWGAAKNRYRYFRLHELRELMAGAGLTDIETGTTGFLGALGRSEGQKRFLGHIDGALCPLLPKSWHYIGFGSARKPQSEAAASTEQTGRDS